LTGTCPLSWTLPNTPTTKTKHSATINTTRPSITFPSREEFTHYDIEELNTQLEKNSVSTDFGTRLSCSPASKQNSRSSIVSERSNASNSSAKPWKP
jgi:hypothetical protein